MTGTRSKPLAYGWSENDEMQMVASVVTQPKLWATFGHSLNPACVSTEGAILLLKVARYASEFGDGPLKSVDELCAGVRMMVTGSHADIDEVWSALELLWRVEDTTCGPLENGRLAGLHGERWALMARSAAERQAARFLR